MEDPEGLALNRASFTPALVDFGGAVPPDFSLALPEPQALTAPLPTPLVLTVVDVAGDLALDDGNGARYPFVLDQALTLAPYGLEMTISGTPAAGDQISLTAQSAGGADGGQAQLLAEDRALLEDGTTAAEGYGSLLGFAAAASNRAGLQLEAAEVSRVDAQEFRDAQAGSTWTRRPLIFCVINRPTRRPLASLIRRTRCSSRSFRSGGRDADQYATVLPT